jgi:hypothetical protein
MRNIDGSEFLSNPGLDVVETAAAGLERNSKFKVSAQQISANNAEGADETNAGAAR